MLDTTRLDLLLADLRHAGLVVGVTEMDRLHRVFTQLDDADGAAASTRLRSLLAAVLVKTRDQRAAFDEAFDHWQKRAEGDLEHLSDSNPSSIPLRRAVRQRDTRRRQPLGWPTAALAGCLALASAGLGFAALQLQSGYDDLLTGLQGLAMEHVTPAPPPPPPDEDVSEIPMRERTFTYYRPVLTVQTESVLEPEPETLGLLAACLATLWVLWRRPVKPALQAQTLDALSENPQMDRGPPRVLLPSPPEADLHLLTRGQREMMVWGLDHYVAEEERSHHLDVPASVDATARAGGLLRLHHRPPRYPREVWLWLDASCKDPAAAQLADEVQGALEAQRLPVRRATFWGLPDPLTDTDGTVFRPREMEEHRQRARVVLLTDGRLLRQQATRGDRRGHLAARLRELSHWPRLAVVDFSHDDAFGHLLRRHHLERLEPDALPGFVGGIVTPRATRQATGEAVWAAATALCPAPFEAGTACALADALGLTVSPWALRQLRRHAPGPGDRLEWPRQARVDQLEWLRTAESQGDDDETYQQRAVRFWLQHYDAEMERRADDDDWLESRAARQLQAERWLLALFRPAERTDAVARLWRLFGSSRTVSQWIEGQLASITTIDNGSSGLVRLPVRLNALHPVERGRLLHMGLASRPVEQTRRQPARRRLALGLVAGLALGGVLWELTGIQLDYFLFERAKAFESFLPSELHSLPDGRATASWRQDLDTGQWLGTVATAQGQESILVEPDTFFSKHVVDVSLRQENEAPCVDTSETDDEIWRCSNRRPTTQRSDGNRRHRITVGLVTPLNVPGAEDFASVLLDSGSADLVIIGEDAEAMNAYAAPDDAGVDFRVHVLDPADLLTAWQGENVPTAAGLWTYLSDGIRRLEGIGRAPEAWPQLATSSVRDLELLGLEGVPSVELEMVWIPGGTFSMGTRDDDPRADLAYEDWEQPAQEKTVEGFWMGKTEVTHAQYKQLNPDHTTTWDKRFDGDTRDLPVTDVSWHDAKVFCEALGYRLPTEAEWEYAARAGARTPWSFGKNESQLNEYAWFDGNSENRPHPVGTKLANPWGLHDMHGNAREWMADEWRSYKDGLRLEPEYCTEERPCSVLRGGSYWNTPRNVRSANRFGSRREYRFGYFGFRCVRGHPPALSP